MAPITVVYDGLILMNIERQMPRTLNQQHEISVDTKVLMKRAIQMTWEVPRNMSAPRVVSGAAHLRNHATEAGKSPQAGLPRKANITLRRRAGQSSSNFTKAVDVDKIQMLIMTRCTRKKCQKNLDTKDNCPTKSGWKRGSPPSLDPVARRKQLRAESSLHVWGPS